jgi:hypothetical protein
VLAVEGMATYIHNFGECVSMCRQGSGGWTGGGGGDASSRRHGHACVRQAQADGTQLCWGCGVNVDLWSPAAPLVVLCLTATHTALERGVRGPVNSGTTQEPHQ